MPNGRVYIINSPDLVLAVQKQSKKLSLWFIEATFAQRMAGLSDAAAKTLLDNVHGENGQPSLFSDGMLAMHRELRPSEKLDEMTSTAVQKLAASMSKLGTGDEASIDLWRWVSMNFMTSTTFSVYGLKNPFRNPELAQAYL